MDIYWRSYGSNIGYGWLFVKKCIVHRNKEPGFYLPPRMKLRFTDLLEEHDEREQHSFQRTSQIEREGSKIMDSCGIAWGEMDNSKIKCYNFCRTCILSFMLDEYDVTPSCL